MSKGTPRTSVRLDLDEKAELQALADKAGVTLSDAFRLGARQYLEKRVRAAERPRRRART